MTAKRTLNQILSLELCHAAHEGIDQPSVWGGGVEIKRSDLEMDAPLTERVQLIQSIPGAAIGPIQRPHHQHVPTLQLGDDAFIDRPAPRYGG